jgi:comEA protein
MRNPQVTVLGIGFRLVLAALVAQLCVAGAFAQSSSKSGSGAAKTAALVDVNSADLQTLETLPGVGPATAKLIQDGRPYKTLSDLEKVKGLSKARLEALKDKVTFGSAATSQTAPSPKSSQAKQITGSPASATSTAGGGAATAKATGSSTVTKSASAPAATTDRIAPGQRLNINTASAADLDKLPGIGPAKSKAIVDYRAQNGNFKSIEDIEKVKGIKGGVFSKIKDYIKVSD